MKIIIGNKTDIAEMAKKYVVLELDSTLSNDNPSEIVTFYGVIGMDELQLEKLPLVDSMRKLHEGLLTNYKQQNWNVCEQAIDHLITFWPKGYDEFYTSILDRITELQKNPPKKDWTSLVVRTDK